MIKLNVRLPDKLHSRLKSASEFHGMDFGEILRRAKRKGDHVGDLHLSTFPASAGKLKSPKNPATKTASFSGVPESFRDLSPHYIRALLDWYLSNHDRRAPGFVTDKIEGRDYVIAEDFERCANG